MPHIPDRMKRLMMGGRTVTIDGNTLDITMQLVLASQRAAGSGGLIIERGRGYCAALINTVAGQLPRRRVDISWTDMSLPGPAGDIPARHYRPNEDGAPLLVFYHGGGFVVGGLETHGHLCRGDLPGRRRPRAFRRLSVGTRTQGARRCRRRIRGISLGPRPRRRARRRPEPGRRRRGQRRRQSRRRGAQRARDDGAPPPVLQLLLYPITNYAGRTRSQGLFADGCFLRRWDMDFCDDKYVGGSGVDPADPRVSPLLADDLSGLPPAILVTAGFDPLRDEGRQYADALRAAGNAVDAREYGSLIHAFTDFFTLGGASATATADIISALRAHLSRS